MKKNGKKAQNSKTVTLLKELVEYNKQQINRPMPTKPDVEILRQSKRDKIYTFWEAYVGPSIITSSTLEVDTPINILFSNLGNSASYAAVFDTYRILQVTVEFFPQSTPTISQPSVYTVIDYDDSAASTISALQRYDTLQVVPMGTYFQRTFNPRIATAAYSGVFTSFAQSKSSWIDMASTSVIHYGIKTGVPPTSAVQTAYTTVVNVVFQTKQSR